MLQWPVAKPPRPIGRRTCQACALPSAFYALTAMSDRALAYSDEPLKHRHLVTYEAAGHVSALMSI